MPIRITVPPLEIGFNNKTKEFLYSHDKECTLTLEHSLVSLSKWESKWKKPFLHQDELSKEETVDYIRCMTLTQNVDPRVYNGIGDDIIEQVNEYIKDTMTATWFSKQEQKKHASTIITSERIYSWMCALNIPFETCQKWHLNRLITLIRVRSAESQPPKKMSQSERLARNRAINARNRKKFNSKG